MRQILPAIAHAILLFVILMMTGYAQAGPLISFQGELRTSDGRPFVNGQYAVDFGLATDSIGGSVVWQESAQVTVLNGIFNHVVGSVTDIGPTLFQSHPRLYLRIAYNGEALMPRTRLLDVPYAVTARSLQVHDAQDQPIIETSVPGRSLEIKSLYDDGGIVLKDTLGDAAAQLPAGAVSRVEILDEPGIATGLNVNPVMLPTGEFIDLVTTQITLPNSGYIVLTGKCYVLLSGTVGPNSAIVQIDTDFGGSTEFPYYQIVGLSGYANSGINYFPVFVQRAYFASAGTYRFRLEGRANNATPARAESWDHVLFATYYPTSYSSVKALTSDPGGFAELTPVPVDSNVTFRTPGQYYEVDLREFETVAPAQPSPR